MERKQNYISQLISYTEEYSKILIVQADHVGSKQMQQIRIALRGKATVLMGKNTLIKRGLKMHVEKNPKLQVLFDVLKGNVGLIFTNEDLVDIKNIILENKVTAPARVGSISPVRVVVPAGNTGLEPTKTSFFQALSIPTKITKGTVEIINDYELLTVGEKVGNSEATLLQMLNIKPFYYGLAIEWVYDDGAFFQASVLDLSDQVIEEKFRRGVSNVAALSLALGYPTEASIPHSIINSFKDLLAVAVNTEVEFEQAKEIKEYLKDPSKFAVAAAPAAAAAPAEAAAVEESPEESDDDMGMDLFG